MRNPPEIPESIEWLEEQVHAEQDAQVQRRLHMLLLLKTGEAESRSAAARHLGVHRNTIANWLELYEDGGTEALREIEDPGPDPGQQSIPSEVMEKLKKRLSQPEGFGSYKEIQQWLAEDHEVDLPYSTVHGIVRYDLGAKLKTPRPSHPKKASKSK
ncbi:helix-turn-helix domain-containing protein [Salinibacter ruber]|jgi:transposase|uniref:helix-turn-helix domain-containing protein n=1 Tax=Salinibacter ruber TaxID=146919 RepID=UPI001ABA6718|nr:helix-turn-helix domain-containing protein [Salinibacter ruber]MCS4175256.1 transposase [Salinibacter ruber]